MAAKIFPYSIINIFTSRLSSQIFRLAMPVVLSMVSVTAVLVADTAMIGRLGTEALAAGGSAVMAYWTISSVFMGASYGIQVLVARRFGQKRYADIRKIATTSTLFIIFVSVLATWAIIVFSTPILHFFSDNTQIQKLGTSYLYYRAWGTVPFFLHFNFRGFYDGLGKTRIGMTASITMAIANIGLNYVFIFGAGPVPRFGIAGAGMASSIAVTLSLFIYVFMFFHPSIRQLMHGTGYRFDWPTLKQIIKLSLPASASEGVTNIGFLFFMSIAGNIGALSLAVSNIMFAIMSLSFMPGYAFSIAATTLASHSLGQKKPRKALLGSIRSFIFAAVFMGFMGLLFILSGKGLIGLFTTSQEVINAALIPLIIVSIVQVADAAHMVFAGALRGVGLVNWTFGLYFIATWFVMLPAAYMLALKAGFGTPGLWGSIAIWLTFLAIGMTAKFLKKQWQQNEI